MYVERRAGAPAREEAPPSGSSLLDGTASQEVSCTSESAGGEDTGPCSWGRYGSGAAVDELVAFLNPQGKRESALRRVRPRPIKTMPLLARTRLCLHLKCSRTPGVCSGG